MKGKLIIHVGECHTFFPVCFQFHMKEKFFAVNDCFIDITQAMEWTNFTYK